jgi:gliding motility-associated-like protein
VNATIADPVVEFFDTSSENVVDWQWDFGDNSYSTNQNPTHIYADTGLYTIELIVENRFGCLDTAVKEMLVEPQFTFYIPNSFTPNSDRHNQFFFGLGEYVGTYKMEIFNRWGEMIFTSNEEQYKWDGTYKGSQVQQGQYVYKFNVTDWKGRTYEYVGQVTLHR